MYFFVGGGYRACVTTCLAKRFLSPCEANEHFNKTVLVESTSLPEKSSEPLLNCLPEESRSVSLPDNPPVQQSTCLPEKSQPTLLPEESCEQQATGLHKELWMSDDLDDGFESCESAVKEILPYVHTALDGNEIVRMKFAWIKYITDWFRSGPVFWLVSAKKGHWPYPVVRAASRR